MNPNKPLNMKAYGHIAHLPNSRIGEGDHHCSPGQARIATEKPRDKFDIIIVQEKLDGSNVCVAKKDDIIYPLIRAGYIASTSKHIQHQIFYKWAMINYQRFDKLLLNGERLCGEWLIQAHGTKYNLLHEPFVAFDIFDTSNNRLPYTDFIKRIENEFITPYLIHKGTPLSVVCAMKSLGEFGKHGAIDKVEGVVYRVERKDKVEFLCKYVRPDKIDGNYLIKGAEPVWNCDYERLLNDQKI